MKIRYVKTETGTEMFFGDGTEELELENEISEEEAKEIEAKIASGE